MASYRLEVGKRQKVEPRQIVGALANEGGLSREDFGAIQILPDHSIVQLPADLSRDVFAKLENTRISGKLIELRADHPGAGRRDEREERPERAERKPRHE
jgi:ATP-dependent RNA helicase DeaD